MGSCRCGFHCHIPEQQTAQEQVQVQPLGLWDQSSRLWGWAAQTSRIQCRRPPHCHRLQKQRLRQQAAAAAEGGYSGRFGAPPVRQPQLRQHHCGNQATAAAAAARAGQAGYPLIQRKIQRLHHHNRQCSCPHSWSLQRCLVPERRAHSVTATAGLQAMLCWLIHMHPHHPARTSQQQQQQQQALRHREAAAGQAPRRHLQRHRGLDKQRGSGPTSAAAAWGILPALQLPMALQPEAPPSAAAAMQGMQGSWRQQLTASSPPQHSRRQQQQREQQRQQRKVCLQA